MVASGLLSAPIKPAGEFLSSDLDEVVSVGGNYLAPHRLRLANGERGLEAGLARVDMGIASIIDVRYGADVDIDPGELQHRYLVHTAYSGVSEIRIGDRVTELRPDTMAVTSPNRKMFIRMSRACRHLTVRVERQAMENYLQATINRDIAKPLVFELEVPAQSPFNDAWRNLATHIYQQALAFPDLFRNPKIQEHYAILLMELLLHNHAHNYQDVMERGANDISPWHVRRARELIENQLDDNLSIADLAQTIGVSVRCLQNGFRQFLGVSPSEYVRRCRLENVHKALLAADPARTVTDIMLEHGVVNFGRFAQYYKQHYGCRPSDTLRRRAVN